MIIMYTKAKGRRSSSHERRNGLSIAALVISLVLISATVFLTTMTDESFAQGSTVSTNKTSTTAGNVTAQAVPQGTSLKPNNATASTNKTSTTAGNVTAQAVPQGTSLKPNNATASTNKTSTTAGNVTAGVSPEGTSLISSKNATSSNVSQGTVVATGGGRSNLNCQSIASTIGGIAVPNPNKVCDVLIPRQAPTIIGPGNMNMNKFSTINSIVEVAPVSDLMIKSNISGSAAAGGTSSASGNTSSQKVFVMGEFSLLDPQLVTMVKAAVGYNSTIAAVHNHMVLE